MRGLRFSLWSIAAVAVAGLTACPPAYPKCDNDDHCKDKGEVCVQGQCRECATDEQCKAGFVCDANRCVPKPQCVTDTDCGTGQQCQAGRCVAAQARAPGSCDSDADCPSGQSCRDGMCATSCDYAPIRFDFNEYSLSGQAQQQLSALADCIKRENAKVRIEGHADERGTEEYNLQLSNRRAASVRRYLTDLGVSGKDLDTVGFGENRPAEQGSDEGAWAANRRVEFNRK